MHSEEIQALLPWRPPFLLIDRMLDCDPHRRILTVKNVSAGDPVLGGLASRQTGFPSVLLLEGMSQSAALLFRLSLGESVSGTFPLLGFLKASFERRQALPGDRIEFDVRALKMTRAGGVFEASAAVSDGPLAEAELAFAVVDESAIVVDRDASRAGGDESNDGTTPRVTPSGVDPT